MISSRLDELLIKVHVESYKSNQPILQTVVMKNPILYLLMKISEGQLSKNDRDLYFYTLAHLTRKKFIKKEDNTYSLTDIGKTMIEKIEYELELLKTINKEDINLNEDMYNLLEWACKSAIKNKNAGIKNYTGSPDYSLFLIISKYYNYSEPLTPYFVGDSGIILISLYSLSFKTGKYLNWWYSPRQLRQFLFNNIPQSYNILGKKFDISPLVKYKLVDEKKRGYYISKYKYKLSEEGYNVAEFILKNLKAVIKYRQNFSK
jgi:hypothetical protein